MAEKPTMGSLFAGIGGFDLGFERAGFKTSWQVEIDPYCQKVLEKNFPHAKRFGDIGECGTHNLEPVDVICGGFPCQDISNAGKREGIDGTRSGLWGEMARIIGELRPRFVVVENVAALLGRGIGRVLGDLSEIGYDAEWQVISAADMGAPHLRERIWIVAYPQCAERRPPTQGWDVANRHDRGREEAPGWYGECGKDVAHSPRIFQRWQEQWAEREQIGMCGESIAANANFVDVQGVVAGGTDAEERQVPKERPAGPCFAGSAGQWLVEPDVGRVAHGVPSRVDRLKGLGNAIVPQIAELIARRLIEVL